MRIGTSIGRVDLNKQETKEKLDLFLPPGDAETYEFAISLRETGELIGMGGSHRFASSVGWPEVGYMIKEEHWGKGYTTEFLRAWLKAWDGLPREEVEVRVDPRSVVSVEGKEGSAREMCVAVTEEGNDKSQVVLRKCGFEYFMTWVVEEVKRYDVRFCVTPLSFSSPRWLTARLTCVSVPGRVPQSTLCFQRFDTSGMTVEDAVAGRLALASSKSSLSPSNQYVRSPFTACVVSRKAAE